ncbi:MAG: hypothetical protein QXL15_01150 [Candidatus Korarchaeota archaeon]
MVETWREKIKELRNELEEWLNQKKVVPTGAVVVQDLPAEETSKRIKEIMKKFADQLHKGDNPYFDVPSRGGRNIVYNAESDMVLLGENVTKRYLFSLSTARKTAITARILEIIYQLLTLGIHSTKRDIFYTDVNLFQDQSESDPVLEDVAVMLNVIRNSIHVVADPRGIVVGKLYFREGGDKIDCTRQGNGGKVITPFQDTVTDLESDAEFILLVEKEAAFLRLAEDRFYNKYPCVIVTGRGQPDMATRFFLKRLEKELKLPVLALVDCDPYGVGIILTYTVGSKSLAYEASYLVVPKVKWLGLRPSDIEKYDVPRYALLSMKDADMKRGRELIKEDFIIQRPKWRDEILEMLRTKKKAEIQALTSRGFRYLTEEYLPRKLETGDWI